MRHSFVVKPAKSIKGSVVVPADKSIAHRSIMISAISKGKTEILNFPLNKDCLITLRVFQELGVKISMIKSTPYTARVLVEGKGLYSLKSKQSLFIGDSGTTFRLLSGILAGLPASVILKGGISLSRRPMSRIAQPLRKMGAVIESRQVRGKMEEYPPLMIRGGNLKGISYKMPVASAQVKSCILLAGLFAQGRTTIIEPIKTRDHTEKMLKQFKAKIKVRREKIILQKKSLCSAGRIYIPGDISSASFFIVAATIIPDSRICLKSVGINPTRTGIIKVLRRMGADIKLKTKSEKRKTGAKSEKRKTGAKSEKRKDGEPIGDIFVRTSKLRGTVIKKDEIPSLIDELPILMVAAAKADGKTEIIGAGELKIKETDRINSMVTNLLKMGADIKIAGLRKIIIRGSTGLKGARVRSFADHRTAMSMVIAGLAAEGRTVVDDIDCIAKSFPNFLSLVKRFLC